MCPSIALARQEWNSYTPAWQEWNNDARKAEMYLRQSERLGWLDDELFWKTFWSACEPKAGNNLQIAAVQLYARGAATAGSLSFFRTMPMQYARYVVEAMDKSDCIFEPRVLDFMKQIIVDLGCPYTHASFQRTYARQRSLFWAIRWDKKGESPLLKGRGEEIDLTTRIMLIDEAVRYYRPDLKTQVHLLGHTMSHMPDMFWRENIADVMREKMGPWTLAFNLDTIALCSGYGSNTDSIHKGIKSLGRSLRKGNSIAGKNPTCPLVKMFKSSHPLNSPMALYEAVIASGIIQTHVERLEIPADTF